MRNTTHSWQTTRSENAAKGVYSERSVRGRIKIKSWSGYNDTYVQNIINGAMKALQLLSILTFDPGLLFWTQGLKNHLEKKTKEAERKLKDMEQYNF